MSAVLDLKDELDRAYEQYDLCKYIDSTARMQQEQSYWSRRIETLKEQIAEIENE